MKKLKKRGRDTWTESNATSTKANVLFDSNNYKYYYHECSNSSLVIIPLSYCSSQTNNCLAVLRVLHLYYFYQKLKGKNKKLDYCRKIFLANIFTF